MDTEKLIVGECRTYSDIAQSHRHPFAQLILPLEGVMSIETDEQPSELNESRLFFLPPGCRHTFRARSHNRFLVLDVAAPLLAGNGLSRLDRGRSDVLDERWQALRTLMLAEVERQVDRGKGLLDLFRYAYDHLLVHRLPRSLAYIHRHYDQHLDLSLLAALEGFHPTYYSEWFKQITGTTVTSYLQKLRLDQAKTLLQETDLPILHIAQQVGYEHHASLTRLFQQYERVTPSVFRQQNRKLAKKRLISG